MSSAPVLLEVRIQLVRKEVLGNLEIMTGASHVDESQFKGLSKYFNSTTSTGRANVDSEVLVFAVVVLSMKITE